MAQQQNAESDPRHHTSQIKERLRGEIQHLRDDVREVSDPKAQALFETTAEVLNGLVKAFEDYEQGTERAWRS